MIVMSVEVVCVFGLLFFTCETGERFKTGFDDISDEIDQFSWYAFPTEVKRLLPIIILIAQQPVAVECFGSIMCLRESFRKVSLPFLTKHQQHLNVPSACF